MAKYFLKYCIFTFFVLICSISGLCQDKGLFMGYIARNSDTLYLEEIKPVYVYGRPKSWEQSRQWRKYYRTVYNFAKTYPYALKACEIMKDADSTIAHSNFTRWEKEK